MNNRLHKRLQILIIPQQRIQMRELVRRIPQPLRGDVARDDEREVLRRAEVLDGRVERVREGVLEEAREVRVGEQGGHVGDDLLDDGAVEGAAGGRGPHVGEAQGTGGGVALGGLVWMGTGMVSLGLVKREREGRTEE